MICPYSRRTFLRKLLGRTAAIAGVCVAAPLLSGCRGEGESDLPPPGPVSLGPSSKFRLGKTDVSLYRVQVRVAAGEQGREYSALSLVCTHQTCLLKRADSGSGFRCPCHGSRFDDGGQVLEGPALEPLKWFKLSFSPSGDLLLHTTDLVDADWRLKA